MRRRTKSLLLAATAALGVQAAASAAPVVQMAILGTTTPSDPNSWSASVQASPGDTVFYEAVAYLNPAGTSNTHGSVVLSTQASGSDGVQSLTFTFGDTQGDSLAINPVASWQNATGAYGTSSGTNQPTGGFFLGQTTGTYVGANQATASEMFSGSFVVGSWASDTITAGNDKSSGISSTLGGTRFLAVSGSKLASITTATESSSDPYVGFSPLTITATPEPASLGLLAVGGLGLLVRRRRTA